MVLFPFLRDRLATWGPSWAKDIPPLEIWNSGTKDFNSLEQRTQEVVDIVWRTAAASVQGGTRMETQRGSRDWGRGASPDFRMVLGALVPGDY